MEVVDKAKYCPRCGCFLDNLRQQERDDNRNNGFIYCPNCGNIFSNTFKICKNCGYEL